jgi:shikimate dehydrogenase
MMPPPLLTTPITMLHFAVLGHPVAHSRSPALHGGFAAQCGIDLRYEALDVAPEALADTLARLHAEGYRGLNLTLPHKQAALALCESLSEAAQQAGAVNTLVRTDTGWHGDNTDGAGFIEDLRALGVGVAGKTVLIVGAGGAARGLIAPLLAEQPSQLVLSSRNPWKPESLAQQFAGLVPRTHLAMKGDRFDLVINATSAGHQGQMPRLPLGLATGSVVYDLSYGEAHAPCLAWAESQGASAVYDGLGMLKRQAALAFQRWLGVLPSVI